MRFYHRLALALGCTVRQLLASIDSQELTHWLAYYRLEPWGEWRSDARAATICSVIANALRTRGPAVGPEKFMLKFEGDKRQTPEEMAERLATFTAMVGGIMG